MASGRSELRLSIDHRLILDHVGVQIDVEVDIYSNWTLIDTKFITGSGQELSLGGQFTTYKGLNGDQILTTIEIFKRRCLEIYL